MISMIASPYLPRYAATLVYMLQNTEYRVWPYLKWYWRTQNFATVEKRRKLERTRSVKMLLYAIWLGMALQVAAGVLLIYLWYRFNIFDGAGWAFGLALVISYPIIWAHLVIVPLVLGRILIIKPRERWRVMKSEEIFRDHKGAKIAIAGSYGKTSMKELLLTVLSEGKKVAATPANKNVAISHANFAHYLTGAEDIVLIEYGEGAPGDVMRFAETTHPTYGVITGVAAAHLDKYKTVENAAADIFSLADYLKNKNVYVNGESPAAEPFIRPSYDRYDESGVLGWKVSDVTLDVNGTEFTLKKGKQTLKLKSGLLGQHQLGPLSLAAVLSREFGLTDKEITDGIAKTKPFEHRMQPYQLSGAWIIDDTYNGNIEGIRAGTALLKELTAKRKLYVTPGLVDQGKETKQIHEEMGRLIAASGVDLVVLMQNSVTKHIEHGLEAAGFKGEVKIETSPVDFYTNLGQFVAVGDLVMMQNDWPDNYA